MAGNEEFLREYFSADSSFLVDHFGFDHVELYDNLFKDYKFQVWIHETQYKGKEKNTFKEYIDSLDDVSKRIIIDSFIERYEITPTKVGSVFYHAKPGDKLIYYVRWEDATKAFSILPEKDSGSTLVHDSYVLSCVERSDSYFLQLITPHFQPIPKVAAFCKENEFDDPNWGDKKYYQPMPPFCKTDVSLEWISGIFKNDLKDLNIITDITDSQIPLSETEVVEEVKDVPKTWRFSSSDIARMSSIPEKDIYKAIKLLRMAEPFSQEDAILITDCAQSYSQYEERLRDSEPRQSQKPLNSVDWKKWGIIAGAGIGMALVYAVTRSNKASAAVGTTIYKSSTNHFYKVAAAQAAKTASNQAIATALNIAIPIFTGVHTGPRGGKYRVVNGKKRYDIP